MKFLYLAGLIAVLIGCKYNRQQENSLASVLTNEYANGFSIENNDEAYIITVMHPNDHSVPFQKFALYRKEPLKTRNDIEFQLKIPLKDVAALSVTHIGFINALNAIKSVKGVTDPFRVYNSEVKYGIEKGEVQNLGESMVPDTEKILAMHPDAVFMSGFPNAKENNRILKEAGVPVIYTVAWTEKTPLARAEWIKFFGLLYDKEAYADSVFSAVVQHYKTLVNYADSLDTKPDVFCGNSFKGVWYLPGGKSYVSGLIKDAGGNYIFNTDTTSGSMAVSFEVVYSEAKNADYWLNVQEKTISEMLSHDKRYGSFRPVEIGNVYNRQGRGVLNRGNDYFETGTWRPDLVLSDLIHILHPETGRDSLIFYKRLDK
ncbi:ABC transporter substrate-binding protein [Saccharicrinis sp. FJH62]|uniref:ABC transporter substrate-binding protein n=1 Tax=Saccharicrinis sp. FJH62 TaxID=3344657 RepID=UPI0035D409A7